jgi:hypothetical protein
MAFFRITRVSDVILLELCAVAILICLVALTPIAWTALEEIATHQAENDPRACLFIKNESERLHCLEVRVGRNPPPARGANAPLAAFGGKETQTKRR